jgi:hypothetical protein
VKYSWQVTLTDVIDPSQIIYRAIALDFSDLRPLEMEQLPVEQMVEAIDRALKEQGIETTAIVVTEQSEFRYPECLK